MQKAMRRAEWKRITEKAKPTVGYTANKRRRRIPKKCSEHVGLVKYSILLKNIAINLTMYMVIK